MCFIKSGCLCYFNSDVRCTRSISRAGNQDFSGGSTRVDFVVLRAGTPRSTGEFSTRSFDSEILRLQMLGAVDLPAAEPLGVRGPISKGPRPRPRSELEGVRLTKRGGPPGSSRLGRSWRKESAADGRANVYIYIYIYIHILAIIMIIMTIMIIIIIIISILLIYKR